MVRPFFDDCIRPHGLVGAWSGGFARVVDDVPTFVPAPGQESVFERLVELGLANSAMADAVAGVLSHPTPDAVLGAARAIKDNLTMHGQVVEVARAAVDGGHAAKVDQVVRGLTERGITGNGVARRVVELVDDPRLDEILDLTGTIRDLGGNGHAAVDTAVQVVGAGRTDTFRAAAHRLAANQLQSPVTAAALARLVDHPRLDRIIEVAPTLHALDTPIGDAIDIAQRLVDAGADHAALRAAGTLAEHGVTGTSVAGTLESIATDARLDEVVDVAPHVVASGTMGGNAIEAARSIVGAGHAPRIVATLDSLVARGVTGHGLADGLAGVAAHRDYDAITAIIPDLAALGTRPAFVADLARAAVESGHADRVAATARTLAEQGLRSPGALATDLVAVAARPDLDHIIELLPRVRELGTQADDLLDVTVAAIDTGASASVFDVAHQLTATQVMSHAAVREAANIVGAGLTPHDVTRVVQLGMPIGRTSPRASIERALDLLDSDLPQLDDALGAVPAKGFDEYATILAAIVDRVGRTRPVDATDTQLLARIDTLARDNFRRTTGALRDGYSRHPDYAEVGRLRSTIAAREQHLRSSSTQLQSPLPSLDW